MAARRAAGSRMGESMLHSKASKFVACAFVGLLGLCDAYPALAELQNTFRVAMFRGALEDCKAQTYRNADPTKYSVFYNALNEICSCEATMDAANVTLEEFQTIARTGDYFPSFRARKDGYVKWCISIYVDIK